MPFSVLLQSSTSSVARSPPYRTATIQCLRGMHGPNGLAGGRNLSGSTPSARVNRIIERHMRVSPSPLAAHLQPCHRAAPCTIKISAPSRKIVAFLPVTSMVAVAQGHQLSRRVYSTCSHTKSAPEIEELFHGNTKYMDSMTKDNPGLLAALAIEGQSEYPLFRLFLSEI